MIGRIATALACLLLSELILSSPTTAVPLPPVLTSGSETVNVGDVFTIPISIADTDGLTSFQFDLAFNPSIIAALNFTDVDIDPLARARG